MATGIIWYLLMFADSNSYQSHNLSQDRPSSQLAMLQLSQLCPGTMQIAPVVEYLKPPEAAWDASSRCGGAIGPFPEKGAPFKGGSYRCSLENVLSNQKTPWETLRNDVLKSVVNTVNVPIFLWNLLNIKGEFLGNPGCKSSSGRKIIRAI